MRAIFQHKCGHPFSVHVLSADSLILERHIIESTSCLECRVNVESEQIQKLESLFKGLPELTGSRRQVAWARMLRSTYIHAVINDPTFGRKGYIRINDPIFDAEYRNMFSFYCKVLLQAEARWWIERRHLKARELFEKLLFEVELLGTGEDFYSLPPAVNDNLAFDCRFAADGGGYVKYQFFSDSTLTSFTQAIESINAILAVYPDADIEGCIGAMRVTDSVGALLRLRFDKARV